MAKTDAKEFTTGTLDLGDDIVLSRKMRVVGMLYLEDKYDKPMADIDFGGDDDAAPRMGTIIDLLVAMMLSHDPDLDPADALRRLGTLDADDLKRATKIIKAGTETGDAEPEPVGNVEPPAAK